MKRTFNHNRVPERHLLSEHAYENLKHSVLNGTYQANERLVETKLAARMGISRTPVREAILKLEQEGFVYKLPTGGHAVCPATEEDTGQVRDLAGIILGYAAYLVANLNTSNSDLNILRRIARQTENHLASGDRGELVNAIIKFCDALLLLSKNNRLRAIFNDLNGHVFGKFNFLSDMEKRHAFLTDQKTLIKLMEAGQASSAEKLGREFLFKKQTIQQPGVRSCI